MYDWAYETMHGWQPEMDLNLSLLPGSNSGTVKSITESTGVSDETSEHAWEPTSKPAG